jgi:hypothetical protein
MKKYASDILRMPVNNNTRRLYEDVCCTLFNYYYDKQNIVKMKIYIYKLAYIGSYMSCFRAIECQGLTKDEMDDIRYIYVMNHEKEDYNTIICFHIETLRIIKYILYDLIEPTNKKQNKNLMVYGKFLLYLNKLIDEGILTFNGNDIRYYDDKKEFIQIFITCKLSTNYIFPTVIKNFKCLVDSLKIHNKYKPGGSGYKKAKEEYELTKNEIEKIKLKK